MKDENQGKGWNLGGEIIISLLSPFLSFPAEWGKAPGSSFNVQCGTRIFFNIQHNTSDFTLHFALYNKCYFKK